MARYLRYATSVDVPIGPFLDATDGVTPETGLTITQPDIRLKKNAGAWAQKNAAQTLSHEENGFYEVTLDATDTNTLGLLRLAVAESGAMMVWEDFVVLSENVYDSLIGGGDFLDIEPSSILTTAMTEAYSTDGGTVTVAQALYELLARDQEISISGTTMTIKKRDGTTTAYTLTLDDATTPTTVSRSA